MSSGSCSGAISRSSCWNSSSQRSEPIGLRAPVASPSGVALASGSGAAVASPSVVASSATVGATASETTFPEPLRLTSL